MISLFQQRSRFSFARCEGAALVVVLSLIVLITVAVLAFFSSATFNRRIESSRANRSKADLLAESGGTYAIGRIVTEITDPNRSIITTTSGISIFEPSTAANAYPERLLASGISMVSTTFSNLIRQSAPGADENASDHNTASIASNGRKVDTNRWNEPYLLTGNGFAQSDQLPNWIYLNRKNGITTTKSGEIIGRFSYNIYHIGGLLNANAAGYVNGLSSDLMTYLKAGQTGADLTRLSSPMGQADVDALTSFRFPDNPAGASYVWRMLGSSANGFLSVQNNEISVQNNVWSFGGAFKQNMFDCRQDLIRYAKTQNTKVIAALPYLTHFSRAVNAPSYKPPAGSTNPDIPNVRFAIVGSVTHYDDRGVANTYQVKEGDPLLQRRFSLAKLAWLTPTGPATDISDEAIRAVFGLKWSNAEERWNYVGSIVGGTGSAMLGSIKTLTEIAAEANPREPNFFELLKAGILGNTLGGAVTISASADTTVCDQANLNLLDSSVDLHVLKIGANIIDNADTDNYPTRLALQYLNTPVEKAGIEDLPYFYTIDTAMLIAVSPATTTSTTLTACDLVWVPELLALHQPSVYKSGPGSIQVEIMNGLFQKVAFCKGGEVKGSLEGTFSKDLSALPPIPVPVDGTNFKAFRDGPKAIHDAGNPFRLGASCPSTTDSSLKDVLGFHLLSYATDFNPSLLPRSYPNGETSMMTVQVSQVMVSLRYRTPNGQMKTYATLAGNEAFTSGVAGTGIIGFLDYHDFLAPVLRMSRPLGALLNEPLAIQKIWSHYLMAWDPRTSRFGPALGKYSRFMEQSPEFKVSSMASLYIHPFDPPQKYLSTYSSTGKYPSLADQPFAITGNLPQAYAFQDPDGYARQPDGGLGFNPGSSGTQNNNVANPYTVDTSDPTYGKLNKMDARPVILQRPYRSVAELGYVSRDVPWQTLNFYNINRKYGSDVNSGDAGLLDLFSVVDEPAVTAGHLFLGISQQPVLEALLKGAALKADGTSTLSTTISQTVATAFKSYAFSSGIPTSKFPVNVANLVPFLSGIPTANLGVIKNQRESVMRVLSSTQSRTWNILVDVVAQTGRFPGQSLTAGDFVVEGESRFWISVAIDRYTGKIVDQQIEKVNE